MDMYEGEHTHTQAHTCDSATHMVDAENEASDKMRTIYNIYDTHTGRTTGHWPMASKRKSWKWVGGFAEIDVMI